MHCQCNITYNIINIPQNYVTRSVYLTVKGVAS